MDEKDIEVTFKKGMVFLKRGEQVFMSGKIIYSLPKIKIEYVKNVFANFAKYNKVDYDLMHERLGIKLVK